MNTAASINALASQAGYQAAGGTNGENDFTKWQTDGAWSAAAFCDSFAQWGAVGNGGFQWQENCQFGPKGDAYVPYSIKHAQDLGLWEDKGQAPQPGWQVCFDWNFNGVADHIGTIVEDRGATFVTIEGNTGNGQVKFCVRDRTFVMGFVALADDSPPPPPPPPPADYAAPDDPGLVWYVKSPMFQGSSIGYMQQFFNEKCGKSLTQDGVYGGGTRSAVVDFQRFFNLDIDGAVGPQTWNTIQYIAAVTGFTG